MKKNSTCEMNSILMASAFISVIRQLLFLQGYFFYYSNT